MTDMTEQEAHELLLAFVRHLTCRVVVAGDGVHITGDGYWGRIAADALNANCTCRDCRPSDGESR